MINHIFNCDYTGRMPADIRREQILQTAVDLFSQRGFKGTTTKELAKAAGVSEADWNTRRMVLEKHLIRPVRSWRTEQSAQFALHAAKDPRPPVETAEAVDQAP